MAGRLDGRVAFVTGAGLRLGRSHAVRLAEEGADIIAVESCSATHDGGPGPATEADLADTAELVVALGRRVVRGVADVRDCDGLRALMHAGRHELGRLDIVVATAADAPYPGPSDIDEASWNEMIDTDVRGVWHTINSAVPYLLEQETGSIIVCASAAGVIGVPGLAHHVAARAGAIGLMRAFASELAGSGIRVNAVCPTQIDSPMTFDDNELRSFRSGLGAPASDGTALSTNMNVMSVCWAEPRDVSNAVLFLASDEARYITGTALPVDAGILVRAIAR